MTDSMKKSAVLLTLGLVSVLGGCNYCAPQKIAQYELVASQTFAITKATGTTATTAGIKQSLATPLDRNGHFVAGVLDGGFVLVLTIDDDVHSQVLIDEDPLLQALDASGKNLRTAHQALEAGTTFTFSASTTSSHYDTATVTATVVSDVATPLTLSFDVRLAGSQSAVVDGTQPFVYVDSSYEQGGACG